MKPVFRKLKNREYSNKKLLNLLHIIGWGLVLVFPLFFFSDTDSRDVMFFAQLYMNIFIYGIVFYVNYSYLVSRFFYGEERVTYLLLVLLLVTSAGILLTYINGHFLFSPENMPDPPLQMGPPFDGNPDISIRMHKPGVEAAPPFVRFKVISHFISSFLVCGFSLGLKLLQTTIANEQRTKELEKEKLNSELAFLKSQISPHFFFNTLNNIYSLIGINTNDAQESVLKLSKLMRYLLYESDKERIRLSKEIEFLKHYLDLMKLRLSKSVSLEVCLPENYPDISIPPLLFISFIENAFKHGVSYQDNSFISMKMTVDNDKIHFVVANSIRRRVYEYDSRNSGIGLDNIIKRLNLLYPQSHNLKVVEKDDKFIVDLELNLNKTNGDN